MISTPPGFRRRWPGTRHHENSKEPGLCRVVRIRRDGVASKLDEVGDVCAYERPPFQRGVGQLSPIIELDIAGLMRGSRVDAVLPEDFSNRGRQILVEVDLHRAKRTSPGYCLSIVSGVSAAFASIF